MCCNKESAKELKQARAPLSRQASSLGKRGAWAAHLTFVLILVAHWTGWHSCSLGAALAASHASSRSRSNSYPSMTFPPFGLSLTGWPCVCWLPDFPSCSGTEPIAIVPAKLSPQKLELAFSARSVTILVKNIGRHTENIRLRLSKEEAGPEHAGHHDLLRQRASGNIRSVCSRSL